MPRATCALVLGEQLHLIERESQMDTPKLPLGSSSIAAFISRAARLQARLRGPGRVGRTKAMTGLPSDRGGVEFMGL